jgi:hypothetical protein
MVEAGLMKIRAPDPTELASYIVFTDGVRYYAKSGKTGIVEFSSTDRYDVIKYVFDNAPDNSLIIFKLENTYSYFKPKFVSGGYDLSQITFKIKKIIRTVVPYDDPNLSITVTDQRFIYSDDRLLLTKITVSGSTTLSVGNGVATITGPATGIGEEYYVYSIDTIPALLVIVAEVDSWNATLGTNYANPLVAVIKDANNRMVWLYDTFARRFNSYRVTAGTAFDGEVRLTIDMTPPFKLIMVVNYKSVFCFYEKDGKVVYVGRIADTGHGWNDLTVWRTFKIGFGAFTSDNLNVSFRRFKIAYAPLAGVRDGMVVTDKYGAPLIIDGRMYFITTVASQGEEIPTVSSALFSIDASGNLRFEKPIAVRRVDIDNKLYGDHASHIVYDPDTGKFIFITSSWVSQSPVRLLLGFTDMNLGERAPMIIDVGQIALAPNPAQDVYDPYLVFDLDVKKWRLTFTNSWPNIFVYENSNVDTTGWTEVSRATFTGVTEGSKIVKVNGKWYITLAKSDEPAFMAAVDYPTLANKFAINADVVAGTSSSPPHPTIIPIPVGTKTKYLLITTDRTSPRANQVIMEAEQTNDGYEYPLLITS